MAFVIYIKLNLLTAVTNSGMGTWDLGREDSGMRGRGTRGRRNTGLGDVGMWDSGTMQLVLVTCCRD